jgi:hypothetical protein
MGHDRKASTATTNGRSEAEIGHSQQRATSGPSAPLADLSKSLPKPINARSCHETPPDDEDVINRFCIRAAHHSLTAALSPPNDYCRFLLPRPSIQDEPGHFAGRIPDEGDPDVIFVVYDEFVA